MKETLAIVSVLFIFGSMFMLIQFPFFIDFYNFACGCNKLTRKELLISDLKQAVNNQDHAEVIGIMLNLTYIIDDNEFIRIVENEITRLRRNLRDLVLNGLVNFIKIELIIKAQKICDKASSV